jgi:hypothetical protein
VNQQQPRAVSRRWVVAAAGTVALLFVVIVGGWLLGTRVRTTGTNSVAPRFPLPAIKPGQKVCLAGLDLPKDTNAMRLWMAGGPRPVPVAMRLRAGGQTRVAKADAPLGRYETIFHFERFAHETKGTACLSAKVTIPSAAGQPLGDGSEGTELIDGKPRALMTVNYLHYPSRNLLSALPAGARHASLFRAGFVGAWTYWLLALAVLLCWIAGIRVLLRSFA